MSYDHQNSHPQGGGTPVDGRMMTGLLPGGAQVHRRFEVRGSDGRDDDARRSRRSSFHNGFSSRPHPGPLQQRARLELAGPLAQAFGVVPLNRRPGPNLRQGAGVGPQARLHLPGQPQRHLLANRCAQQRRPRPPPGARFVLDVPAGCPQGFPAMSSPAAARLLHPHRHLPVAWFQANPRL